MGMVTQSNKYLQRKFKPHSSGLNYKDTHYQKIRFYIYGPDKKKLYEGYGWSRCLWHEMVLPAGTCEMYAFGDEGGAHYAVRVYSKNGTAAELSAVEGATTEDYKAVTEAWQAAQAAK